MDKELEKYYELQLQMFASEAWKLLIEDVETMLASTDRLSGVTAENLGFKQGETSMMRWIIGREADVTEAYRELKNADV